MLHGDLARSCRSVRRTLLSALAVVTLAQAPEARCADDELTEIVVTAQRQSEKIQDVPIAITALSTSDLIEHGVRQAGDVVLSVPNMLLNSPYGPEAQPTFTLRGVTTQDFSENQSSFNCPGSAGGSQSDPG
jgi:iron complex outermembrane receptor protein